MLCPGDAQLVGRDVGLSSLGFVLDGDAVGAWLRERAPAAGIQSVRALYARYKPATSCLVSYEVECSSGAVLVTAKAYRLPAIEKIDKAVSIAHLPSAIGPAALVVPESAVVLTVFPYDLQLRPLRYLMGTRHARVLGQLLPEIGRDVRVQVLSYKPERRLVARVEGHHSNAVVRVYASAEDADAAAERIGIPRAPVLLARTLARHPRYSVVATEWLDGEPGTVALTDTRRASEIGEALARVHDGAGGYIAPRARSAADEARHLRAVGRGLVDLQPPLASRVEFIASALADAIADADAPPVLTHGDFALQQAVFTAGGVALTDLDEAAMAHPASDIGSFVADLEFRAIAGDLRPRVVAETVAHFIEGYTTVRPMPRGVDAYAAAGLLRRAPLPFRTRLPDWPARIEAIIARCDALPWRAASGRLARAIAAVMPEHDRSQWLDASMPWLESALDPDLAGRLFANACGSAGLSVESAQIVRHKRGRRCLLRYQLRGATHDVVFGKTRAKGLDRTTAALNELLSRDGFHSGSADGIEVPAFAGVVRPLRMWLQASADGQPAADLLRAGDLTVARRLPEVFFKLQRLGPQPGRTHTVADELRTLDRRLTAFAERRPHWRERIARLLEGCVSLAATVSYAPLTPAHRDFYPDQVIVQGDRLIMLDLDLYALAHPALDAGNLVAHAIELGLRADSDPRAFDEVVPALEEAIDRGLSSDLRPAVDVFTTLTLARLVDIDDLLRHRRDCVEPLVELCETRLSQAGVLAPVRHRVAVPAW